MQTFRNCGLKNCHSTFNSIHRANRIRVLLIALCRQIGGPENSCRTSRCSDIVRRVRRRNRFICRRNRGNKTLPVGQPKYLRDVSLAFSLSLCEKTLLWNHSGGTFKGPVCRNRRHFNIFREGSDCCPSVS